MPQNVLLSVLKRGIERKVPDALMQDCVGIAAQRQLQGETLALLTANAASFPLSIARIHVLAEEPTEALATLEGHLPDPDLDRLIGQVLVVTVRLMDDKTTPQEDAENFSKFAGEAIPLIQKLKASPLEPWQRLAVYQEIQRALSLARKFGQDRVEELRFLSDSLANQEKDEDFKRGAAVIESQFE
jgi:hypothetical protein